MVIYSDWLVPKPFAAYTRACFIFIKPRYKHDEGLYQHERTHVKQWLITLGFHSLLYLFSSKYRFKAEVEAFRKQLQTYELNGYSTLNMVNVRDKLAWFLYTNYDISESLEECKLALVDENESL